MTKLRTLLEKISAAPIHAWVLLAFGLAYVLFLVDPVFLRTNQMEFYRYVPAGNRIGIDLKLTLSWSEYWLHGGPVPDKEGTIYPPLASMLFSPLLAFKFAEAYRILTIATVLIYAATTLVLPGWMMRQKGLTVVAVLIAATGLVSYGLQFELERGQFSVLTIFLALTAVWLFQQHPRWRILAYVLFITSVQLKIYPIVFLPLFVEDWRKPWPNVRRLGLLGLVNVLLLFVTGMQGFEMWLTGLRRQPIYVWVGNPSAYSFLVQLGGYAAARGSNWLLQNVGWLTVLLLLAIAAGGLVTLLLSYKSGGSRPSAYYIMAATIACVLVPPGGHDYRLATLGGPLVMVLLAESAMPADERPVRSLARKLALFVLCLAYAVTLFPYLQRPFYLANSFPLLMVMLAALTILALTSLGPVAQVSTSEPVADEGEDKSPGI